MLVCLDVDDGRRARACNIVRPIRVIAVAFITNLPRNALGRIVDVPDFHRAALHVERNLVHTERATVNVFGRSDCYSRAVPSLWRAS